MAIDFESDIASRIFKLSKKDICKRLQVAVRDTQGRTRASWARDDRPSWWKEKYFATLPDGERVESLVFASQSKSYWPVERARLTLLLFEYRDQLGDDSASPEDGPAEQKEPPCRGMESPKLVQTTESEQDAPCAHDEKEMKETPREEPADAPRLTRRRAQAEQEGRTVAPRRRHVRTKPIQISDDESQAETITGQLEALDVNGGNPLPAEQTDKEISGDVAPKNTDQAAEKARLERIAAIDADEAEFRRQLNKRLAEFRKLWETKKLELHKLSEREIANIESAHHTFRMKNFSQRILDMPLEEFVRDYNADAHEHLVKHASQRAQRVFEEGEFSNDFSDYTAPAPTPFAQARREEVTATARKATRAARMRQGEFAVPTTSLRSRPQRSAAKVAANRTQAMLQGGPIRGTAAGQSVRRTARRPRPTVPAQGIMKTPAESQTDTVRVQQSVRTVMASLRKQPLSHDLRQLVLAQVRAEMENEDMSET